jgi:two-component system, OmpR family, sensor kinase
MQRRLTLAIVGLVAGALVVAGLVTLLFVARAARDQTRRELVHQAESAASGIANSEDATTTAGKARAAVILSVLRQALKVQDAGIVVVGPRGGIANGDLPTGLKARDVDGPALLDGRTVSGIDRGLVYAVAPFRGSLTVGNRTRADVTQAVILTRHPITGLGKAARWFILAAFLALVVAVVVGDRLGRRITGPLHEAEVVTRHIADGDLTAQVPVSSSTDPELASLAHSINSMAAALARSRGLERQFLLSVSHDLRTPLTSIRGFAEAIADGAAPDTHRAAEVIAAESRRLERLVRDLLDLAKLEARQFSLDMRPIDLSEVTADTAEGFRPAADQLGVDLTVATPPEPLTVSADPDRLAQVVANLVENAMKFATTRIDVTTSLNGKGMELAVTDDGPGIPAEDLPRVFERLYTSSRTPTRQVGSGLGLAIVAELVAAMHGTVRAESTAAGGTRMIVAFTS